MGLPNTKPKKYVYHYYPNISATHRLQHATNSSKKKKRKPTVKTHTHSGRRRRVALIECYDQRNCVCGHDRVFRQFGTQPNRTLSPLDQQMECVYFCELPIERGACENCENRAPAHQSIESGVLGACVRVEKMLYRYLHSFIAP